MNPAWLLKARALAGEKIKGLTVHGAKASDCRKVVAHYNKAEGKEATLYVYDQIGRDWWSGEGCTAKDVIDSLQQVKADGATSLAVRILSPGGDVFEGNAIHEALKRCGLKTTAYNDGLCASAATMVALGCERVVAAPTSMWMMHCAWSLAMGNATDMRAMADLLSQLDSTLAGVYADKSGKTSGECLALMQAGSDGTWMTAEECKTAGFADEIASDGTDAATAADAANAAADPVARLMAQTAERTSPASRDRIAAMNRGRLDAAILRAKNSGASPGSKKPDGQPVAPPKT